MRALSLTLKIEPQIRHLVLTCNRLEKLTTTFEDDPQVKAITLDEPTNDKSLAMTTASQTWCWPRASEEWGGRHPLLLFLHFSSFPILCLLLVFNVIKAQR